MKAITICLITVLSLFISSANAQNVNLGGQVWWDFNDNGVKESNEPVTQWYGVSLYQDNDEDGIADAGFTTLYLSTDALGNYMFTNLAAGKYFVKLDAGYSHYKTTVYGGHPDNNVINDNNGFVQNLATMNVTSQTITLAPGTEPDGTGATNTNTNKTLNFGTWKANGLGDMVWLDNNGNGTYEVGEPGLPNVTVTLKDAIGNTLETTTTDAQGKYSFYDPMGYYGVNDYKVVFGAPIGYIPTLSNMGADDDNDSDPINGVISSINVPMGQWNHSFDAGFKPGSILPIKFTSFTALLKNDKVDLKWTTANEINVDRFIVEKSFDGKTFTNAAIVFSRGANGISSIYELTDNLNNNYTVAYYRIRSMDFDGKTTVTEIRSVKMDTKQDESLKINTYPNPVINEVNITIPDSWVKQKIIYQLINATGVVLKTIQTNNSLQKQTINTNNLPAGMYIITANYQGKVLQQRIIKQ